MPHILGGGSRCSRSGATSADNEFPELTPRRRAATLVSKIFLGVAPDIKQSALDNRGTRGLDQGQRRAIS